MSFREWLLNVVVIKQIIFGTNLLMPVTMAAILRHPARLALIYHVFAAKQLATSVSIIFLIISCATSLGT